jgi:hypothetical protein
MNKSPLQHRSIRPLFGVRYWTKVQRDDHFVATGIFIAPDSGHFLLTEDLFS